MSLTDDDIYKKITKIFIEEFELEPDELVPLWKILHEVAADWTYGSKGWGGENYCMFLSDDEAWEHIARTSAQKADELGCKVFLNTE